MNEIIFKDLNIKHICKPRLKNSYISIDTNAKIVLKTPKVSTAFIEDLLIQKEPWIRKKLLKATQNPPIRVNIEDEVLLFGEIYSIDINEAKELRVLLQKIRVTTKTNILKCYDIFYKLQAKEYLTSRIEHYSKVMSLNYKEIKFRKMRSRWGSCSSKRVITLNSELMKINKELIDYVVVHELAHLVHMNHSKKFHSLVMEYIPNAKNLTKELKNRQNFIF